MALLQIGMTKNGLIYKAVEPDLRNPVYSSSVSCLPLTSDSGESSGFK